MRGSRRITWPVPRCAVGALRSRMLPWRLGAMAILGCLALGGMLLQAGEPHAEPVAAPVAAPAIRIIASEFNAGEADIRAVITSARNELWPFFPDCPLEPIVLRHGGPIVEFRRSDQGEIVMRLNTEKTFWSQYAYQFAHEFCHVLCGFRPGYAGNKWFEETVCETSSLFVLRAMARTWKEAPPYPHWKDYRDALRDYADDIIRGRTYLEEIHATGLAAFYQAHRRELEAKAELRELNGAMAVVLLHLLEADPARWEAVRWLNRAPTSEGLPFQAYLQGWHQAVPARHQGFVATIAGLFGLPLPAAGATGPAGAAGPAP